MMPAEREPSAAAIELAALYLSQAKPQRAREVLERGDAEHPRYWVLLASALHDEDEFARAVRAAREGLKRDPGSVALMWVLGSALTELRDLGAAEQVALAALRLEPQNADMMALYARMLASGGQIEKAGAVLDEAIRLDPHDRRVRSTMALVRWAQGRDHEARGLVRDLLATDPEDPAALLILSTMESTEGNHVASFDRIRRVIVQQPKLFHDLADAMPERRAVAHPMMAPLRPFLNHAGPAVLWLSVVALLLLGVALQQLWLVITVGVVYVLYAIYSHVAYRGLVWWFRRRRL